MIHSFHSSVFKVKHMSTKEEYGKLMPPNAKLKKGQFIIYIELDEHVCFGYSQFLVFSYSNLYITKTMKNLFRNQHLLSKIKLNLKIFMKVFVIDLDIHWVTSHCGINIS